LKAFIDTPLLIYLNTITDFRSRVLYENFYSEVLTKYKLYTDVAVFNEVLYISRKKYNIPYDVTIDFIQTIILPYVIVVELSVDEYEYVVKIMKEYDLKPSDALHVGAMMSNNIAVVISEDKEFSKIPLVKRVWLNIL